MGFDGPRTLPLVGGDHASTELVMLPDGRADFPYAIQSFREYHHVARSETDRFVTGRDRHLPFKEVAGLFLVVMPIKAGCLARPDRPALHIHLSQFILSRSSHDNLARDSLSHVVLGGCSAMSGTIVDRRTPCNRFIRPAPQRNDTRRSAREHGYLTPGGSNDYLLSA